MRAAKRAVAAFSRTRNRRAHGLPYPLIVSLTSYPPRFPTLANTLKSLLDQSVAADQTILWIATEDLAQVPEEVRALERHGLEICACQDLRSYTKLVPALNAFPAAAIVTVDDDCFYQRDLLARLIADFDPADPAIICARAHLAVMVAGEEFAPYTDWPMEVADRQDRDATQRLFPTGVGGVLYPPGAFPAQVTDTALFTALCPSADDVWFFWMAEMAGMAQRRIAGTMPLIVWDESQDVGLLHQNVADGHNDRQLASMRAHFGGLQQYPSRP